MTDAPDTDDEDAQTTTTEARWQWLSTAVVLLSVGSFHVAAVAGVFKVADLSTIPQAWWLVWSAGDLAALAYALGPETLQAVKDFRG